MSVNQYKLSYYKNLVVAFVIRKKSGDRFVYKSSRIQKWQKLSESDRRGLNSLTFHQATASSSYSLSTVLSQWYPHSLRPRGRLWLWCTARKAVQNRSFLIEWLPLPSYIYLILYVNFRYFGVKPWFFLGCILAKSSIYPRVMKEG